MPILFISFTIISSVLIFLVIYLLRFLHFLRFSYQSCFFYLFYQFPSSLLWLVFSHVFYIFCTLFVTLPCYLGFSYQSRLLLSFVAIFFISFTIISLVFNKFLVICLLRFSYFLGFSYQSRFFSSLLRFVFSRVFYIFHSLFVTLLFYLCFFNKVACFYLFF